VVFIQINSPDIFTVNLQLYLVPHFPDMAQRLIKKDSGGPSALVVRCNAKMVKMDPATIKGHPAGTYYIFVS
jgi:hypothetical protein